MRNLLLNIGYDGAELYNLFYKKLKKQGGLGMKKDSCCRDNGGYAVHDLRGRVCLA